MLAVGTAVIAAKNRATMIRRRTNVVRTTSRAWTRTIPVVKLKFHRILATAIAIFLVPTTLLFAIGTMAIAAHPAASARPTTRVATVHTIASIQTLLALIAKLALSLGWRTAIAIRSATTTPHPATGTAVTAAKILAALTSTPHFLAMTGSTLKCASTQYRPTTRQPNVWSHTNRSSATATATATDTATTTHTLAVGTRATAAHPPALMAMCMYVPRTPITLNA
mmetsp:Transcript_13453/g.19450  ORF Transcript_13453/g.19450 Transcript_13453/m.19450 type:complete len:224 (+) Transcript_13453:1906-2577(+)